MTAIRTYHCARFARDERGATAIEYGLIAALIVIAMIGGPDSLGGGAGGMWTKIDDTSLNTLCRAIVTCGAAQLRRDAVDDQLDLLPRHQRRVGGAAR